MNNVYLIANKQTTSCIELKTKYNKWREFARTNDSSHFSGYAVFEGSYWSEWRWNVSC